MQSALETSSAVFNIADFGAVAEEGVKNTDAFAKAIDACYRAGGGRVVVPAGTFLTGPIRLLSNVDLHLQQGAKILFSRDYTDYPLVHTDYEGLPAIRSLSPLWADEAHHISVTGQGVIDGQGEAWRPVKRFKMTEAQWAKLKASGGVTDPGETIWWPTVAAANGHATMEKLSANGKSPSPDDLLCIREYLRPNMVKLSRCKHVLIDGPTFQNSAAWNVHLLLCENVTVKNVTILNPWFSANGDGLDLDSCRGATVVDSHFDCGDDAICIKSGKDEPGRKRGKPCENILINNCTVAHGHGGVTIGSEMSGGVRNVRVSNCVFSGTDIGLRFKSTRGRGGTVENIEISNIVMSDIRHEAISINLYYFATNPKPEPVSDRTPRFRDIHFRNIRCHGAKQAIEVRGLPEMPAEAISFENCRMDAEYGATVVDAKDVSFKGVRLDVKQSPAIQCHNVSGLRFDHVDGDGPVQLPTGHLGNL